MARDYQSFLDGFGAEGSRLNRMQRVVDALWDAFHDRGFSWVGFYLVQPNLNSDSRLVLGPRRDKPACSPIGMHGVCGKAVQSQRAIIVRDVAELGPNYIACDPRDRSEIVIPILDDGGVCDAVLDVDSWEIAAFDEADEAGLTRVLQSAGLRA